ncbi:MAG: hypothetical protein AVDCRST_MAG91-2100, partial [uncultured Sphingomonadaceae bacterium]
ARKLREERRGKLARVVDAFVRPAASWRRSGNGEHRPSNI